MFLHHEDRKVGLIKDGILSKKIIESEHLLWSKGGVPALDADSYDKNRDRIREIRIETDKHRVFSMTSEMFDEAKEEINYGFGRQYYAPLEDWNILDRKMRMRKLFV